MQEFVTPIEVRWSDLDPNVHVRHSVYYDWGALCRIKFLNANGLTTATMQQLQIGPILFREECVFKREIVFGDLVTVNIAVSKSRRDMSRWSIIHQVWKNSDTLSAVITVDGAWLDTKIRKLAVPPSTVQSVFEIMPKTENFEWTD